MTTRMKQVLMIGALVAILAIGAGVAAADSIGNDQDAFLNNVAKRLNVTPAALKAALKGADEDRIDAAVAAGKITKAQGDAMKARAAEGGIPLFGGGGHRGGGFGHHGGLGSLDAAATYLGLTEAQLHTQLESGRRSPRSRRLRARPSTVSRRPSRPRRRRSSTRRSRTAS